MAEYVGFAGGITVNRIVTKKVVHDLVRDSDSIQIIRSGVHFVLGHCAEEIERACEASDSSKRIRIILPAVANQDVVVRAREAGREPEEVLAKLWDWDETYAALAKRLAPHHVLELRTTMEPHRYHAIFSEHGAILGVPWHRRASLTTSSFFIGKDEPSIRHDLHEDFDELFEKCRIYHAGDNARDRAKAAPPVIDDPILQSFGRTMPWVIDALVYIGRAFPDANGNGVTKDHLHAKFGTDKSDCNKRLNDMEDAGFVRRAQKARDAHHGRLLTAYGKLVAEKYRCQRLEQSR